MTTNGHGIQGAFSNDLVDGDWGVRSFVERPTERANGPGANGLMTSPRRCHGYPTVPATNTRGSC